MGNVQVHRTHPQHFTGEEFFQHEFPHERSDLSHWRKRLATHALFARKVQRKLSNGVVGFAAGGSSSDRKSRGQFRLLLADRDIAAGVYPMKRFNWPAQGLPAGMTQKQFEDRYTDYPFNPIGHGTSPVSTYADADGFVVIKRHVFKRMMEKYPHFNYVPDGPPNNPQAHLHWRFFDCMVDPDSGRYLSEDYAFCRRWRDMGGKIWVDVDCKLMHLGQHLFSGNLAESLRVQGRW
jgi:hypothetical protein